ncbi:glycosyltransferase [Bacillus sp. S/N-304-OC-R1]|uniref:glycosyltransferase n=1 Tax=Bacillus sp. S/N-304-OC-R1 TaxID=2758034 RepID=UPI001C8EF1CB|nr:glycosyltransferase [Bacillus sp. S/N-304-OC-R1]MBY0123492.1 glycosyltransferase family 4 protein [Bacillus sp. S/N-304-OC-R1]
MKSVLLYYPFEIAENANSGSKLRPKEMYKAFQEWGAKENIDILLLSGNSSAREALFEQWKAEGKLENVWFCYMENQTIPFWMTDKGHIPKKPFIDKKVMSYLKERHVPVGVFYRDVYWKFDELYPLKGPKKAVMKTIYRMEERFYNKYCQVIFLPSDAMGKFVNIQRTMISLPPGGKEMNIVKKEKNTELAQGLYVGGINNEDYGLFLLLDAMEIANGQGKVAELTIVCREDEYKQLPEEKKARIQELDVTVRHLSGEALNELYREMDFAFIPRYRSTYNDFAVPVKLVEYLSNELPVIATYCQAQREIIETDGYGIICEDKSNDMARAIGEMAQHAADYRANIQKTFLQKHSWAARVEKVKNALVKE